jgi:hypothetical protein
VVVVVAGSRFASPGRASAQSVPPAPPTFIPTPIGAPPGPPAPTSTPTPSVTLTPTAALTATPIATTATVDFSLDAARVARVNNPGNFSGLVAVKPGTRVWLMMYYTVRSLPHNSTRVTSYRINSGGKTIFKIAYKTTIKKSEVGRFSRYQIFDVPSTLPYGSYTFHASLAISDNAQSKGWQFRVAKKEVAVKTSGRP